MLYGLGPNLGDLRRGDLSSILTGRPSKSTERLLDAHRMELKSGTSHQTKRGYFRNLGLLAKPFYWDRIHGDAKDKKNLAIDWALLATTIGLTFYSTSNIAVAFNEWGGGMNDLVQSIFMQDSPGQEAISEQYVGFMKELGGLMGKALGAAFLSYKIGETAKLRWRNWMSDDYENLWLRNKSFYHLQNHENRIDNPDQRIHEDPRNVPEYAFDLTKGMLDAALSIGIFSQMLWERSKPQEILGAEVPHFMFFFCLGYAALGTAMMHYTSKPIQKLNLDLQRNEGDYRGDLREAYEKAESIALNDSEGKQKSILRSSFDKVYKSSRRLINQSAGLIVLRALYNRAASVVPLAVMFPLMNAKELTLGEFSRISNAFGEVQSGLSFYVNNAASIRTANSYMERLTEMRATLVDIDAQRQEREAQKAAMKKPANDDTPQSSQPNYPDIGAP